VPVDLDPTTGNATISYTDSDTTDGVTLDLTTGEVTVDPMTEPGEYILTYEVCSLTMPAVCEETIVTVVVPAAVVATDDTATVSGTVGTDGGTGITNVISANPTTADTVNGNDAVLGTDITITSTNDPEDGVELNPLTGEVTVEAGTIPGVYTIDYEVCSVVDSTVCDTATATITVEATVIAEDDTLTLDGNDGETSSSVVDSNDTINGIVPVIGDTVSMTVTDSDLTDGVSLDATTGEVTVASGTLPGDYTLSYELCSIEDTDACDTATVTVTVPSVVIADIEAYTLDGTNGEDSPSVIDAGDTINGVTAVLSTTVTISNITDTDTTDGVSLESTTGIVTVDPMTAPGEYTIIYEVCSIEDPTVCDETSVTVTVPADIIAVDDISTSADGTNGLTITNIVDANDTLNGNPAELGIDVLIESVNDPEDGVTLNTLSGEVIVEPNTAPGLYSIDYRVCSVFDSTSCDTATIEVTVDSDIVANIDEIMLNGTSGETSVTNVVDSNDTLNGNVAELGVDVTITSINDLDALDGVVLDSTTGLVTVDPGTEPGDYIIEYTICSVFDTSACSTNQVTVVVPSEILAEEDFYSVNGITGGTSENVTNDDTLNGNIVTIDGDVTFSSFDFDTTDGVYFDDTTGQVTVDPLTPAGEYIFEYTICSIENALVCDVTTVTVSVSGTIEAVDDEATFENGGTIENIIDNDLLNNLLPILNEDVIISNVDYLNPVDGIELNTITGEVEVDEETPSGEYLIEYQICSVYNTLNCDVAYITITVPEEEIIIFNEFSPNDDGVNDTFEIDGLKNYPNNRLTIYNRWGNIVYEKEGYDNTFDGISDGRATIKDNDQLPVGTYFYELYLGEGEDSKSGWLYINR